MEETHGTTREALPMEPDPQPPCKGCLKGHPKHMDPDRSGTGLYPPSHQGTSLPGVAPHPCSQPAFGHAVGRATRPWLSHAVGGHTDGETHAPGRRGAGHPQTSGASATSPALSLALGMSPCQTPSTHIPLQWGLEKALTGEPGTPTTSQSSPKTQLRNKHVGHAQRDQEPQNAC